MPYRCRPAIQNVDIDLERNFLGFVLSLQLDGRLYSQSTAGSCHELLGVNILKHVLFIAPNRLAVYYCLALSAHLRLFPISLAFLESI
ncbi:uncharacterized protein BJ212DRAFT_1576232 [Suillus subaureus]|uniref:Uncharacterized protein n=1 Tax=Suillus subaureus TaxID=48587 RepID=A0A9P7EFD1_9AGAM|nr:uncharacterized protein BJ212DRAFT_1576232 [Suillus subaureus]KAG1819325.1 hypothetical protein BJ212DRAFT_1576232 [Suillus subaureus]